MIVPAALALLLRTTFPWSVGLLGFFVFPLAVAYGIVRKELFDIRVVARSSAAYGFVTLAITGVFALLVTSADALFSRFSLNARSPAFSVLFLFLAILAFNPLRVRLQAWVDRTFDRDRTRYRQALREISEAMVSMLSVKEIVDRILIAVTDTMGVDRAMVLMVDDASEELPGRGGARRLGPRGVRCGLRCRPPDLSRSCGCVASAPSVARTSTRRRIIETREDCRDVFDLLDAELLMPILFGVDLLGVIAVARKVSGERLGPDDLQLLRTLANQSSIAIENAKAFDEIAQLNETLEARVEERTQELRETQALLVQSEKMRSLGQLVAGVAHELNNPIGFVHANLQLLDDYIGRLVQGDMDPAKRRAHPRGHRQAARPQPRGYRAREADRARPAHLLAHGLRRAAGGGPRAGDRQHPLADGAAPQGRRRDRARLPGAADDPLLREPAEPGVHEPADERLRRHGGEGEDHRPHPRPRGRRRAPLRGRRPGHPEPTCSERIFDPFFTTKPVGKGTGLGLSLSHGIIERHGGSMVVTSAPGEGAHFTISLPMEPPEGVDLEVHAA